ncbi:MAG: hypothetical protein K8R87_07905 [Verrucomicrobia bacterium]|nr:hypothetical protein [Verrucomicrobiota bacterium]
MAKSPPKTKVPTPSVSHTDEIRSTSHRVMGSRQSERKIERSDQRRETKRGHGSQRKKGD